MRVCPDLFSGMTSRDFRGISGIQEVECFGETLDVDLKLISLQLFRLPESTVLASLNVISNNCMTFGDYSSCRLHPADTHKSRVRVLVHDLEEGEGREYGCTATAVTPLGNAVTQNWKLFLRRSSKHAAFVVIMKLVLTQYMQPLKKTKKIFKKRRRKKCFIFIFIFISW